MMAVLVAGGDGTYHLKVLVPGVAAGAIIGKGGETIAQLQKDTGARVKMSKSHDFYPGKGDIHYNQSATEKKETCPFQNQYSICANSNRTNYYCNTNAEELINVASE